MVFLRSFIALIAGMVLLGRAQSWGEAAGAVALCALALLFLANGLTGFTPWGYLKDRRQRRATRARKARRTAERPRLGRKGRVQS